MPSPKLSCRSRNDPPMTLVAAGAALDLAELACQVAAQFAEEVDRDARFPSEAVAELKSAGLMGALVPTHFGGLGWTWTQVGKVVERLARSCSATSMVYAMHQIQVACLVQHERSATLQVLMERVAAEQLLLASATTERAVSGSIRTSFCSVNPIGSGRVSVSKEASIISYARPADAILVTARRGPDAPATDQVMVAVTAENYALQQTHQWDTLGFRGTESCGFVLDATAPIDAVFAPSFADMSQRTMLPVSHIVWGHLWVGLAAETVSRARKLLRTEARKNPGTLPPMAPGVVDLVNRLQVLRSLVSDATRAYEAAVDQWNSDPMSKALVVDSLGFSIRMNGLKLAGSKAVVELISDAIEICGMPAYQASGPHALGRYLRDAHGSRVMINNNRLAGANAAWLLVSKDEE
jgi:acyl-CoA dehydrogenase